MDDMPMLAANLSLNFDVNSQSFLLFGMVWQIQREDTWQTLFKLLYNVEKKVDKIKQIL